MKSASLCASVLVCAVGATLTPVRKCWADAPIVINFEDVDTTLEPVVYVSDRYQPLGVVFSEFYDNGVDPGTTGPAYVVRAPYGGSGAYSAPNAMGFGWRYSFTTATFVDPATGYPTVTDFVSAMVGDASGEPDLIEMAAYDLDGNLIATSVYFALYPSFGLVSISAPGIHSVILRELDPWAGGADLDDFTFAPVERVSVDVAIDIRPGNYPNSINLGSRGVVPVAVLTTEGFDAAEVDPGSVLFAGAAAVRSVLEDVDGDGDLDALLHFWTQDLLDLQADPSATEAALAGVTWDGTPLVGTDTVRIVPPK